MRAMRAPIDSESPDVRNDVLREKDALLANEELRHYRPQREIIDAAFSDELDRVETDLQGARDDVERSVESARASTLQLIMFGAAGAVVAIAFAVIAIAFLEGLYAEPDLNTELGVESDPILGSPKLLVIAVTISATAMQLYSLLKLKIESFSEARMGLTLARQDYQTRLRRVTEEAVYRSINVALGKEGITAFPARAPRLVELASSAILPSESLTYVREFVSGHDSSAIGIAGSRGAGKSSLIRSLANDGTLFKYQAVLTAPVVYDRTEFAGRLLRDICKNILMVRASSDALDAPPTGVGRSRGLGALLLIGVGAILVMGNYDTVPLVERLSTSTILGATFVLYGGTIGLYAALNAVRRWRWRAKNDPVIQRSFDLLQSLNWEIERSQTAKNVLKMTSGLFELSDEQNRKAKQRDRGYSGIISDTRTLLELLSKDERDQRILIAVDELDKLGDVDDLIGAVNNIKDLFHIDGVHFVVSVSTDALHSFERRGLAGRDAFDSAFDTVLELQRLRASESIEIIASRAPGFPPSLSMYCHAWSGGLARDLLRAARRCVEHQRSDPHAMPVSAIVRRLVVEDVVASANALLRRECETETVWAIRQVVLDIDARASGFQAALRRLGGVPIDGLPREVGALSARARLGCALLCVAHRPAEGRTWSEATEEMVSLRAAIDQIATAIGATAEVSIIREDAVLRALEAAQSAVAPLETSQRQR